MTLEVSVVNTGVAGTTGIKPMLLCRPVQSRSPRRIGWTFGRVFGLLLLGEAIKKLASAVKQLRSVGCQSAREVFDSTLEQEGQPIRGWPSVFWPGRQLVPKMA
jgi:hypothetical protein